ncbi:CPBP family intramembrane metalloprotease [Sphingomonas rhizophila]|uniref:CPBP family intramembrane metalloprotease n=1 Tax=Sphingomonas rhizophila TaxID=2071607 RepID=A0A7G9S9S1_9SPHN|nr:CPBP family intramembrane glutamic endopeptidase [Sphingomonas rhizophila]QNN64596.1 CPBP family intramembrane metalloprotease [Sphingomonas rhizophila]
MHPAVANLMLPLVSVLGVIFLIVVAARDVHGRPISLPVAMLCGAIIVILAMGIQPAPPSSAWGWPAGLALAAGFLACGLWDQRAFLFGSDGPDRGHVAASGLSLAGTMLVGATEELLFRGLMQSSLLSAFSGPGGAVTALFLLNLAFAALHGRHGLTFALSAGFFGMIMSMTVIFSGSLWPAVVTHAAWNAIVVTARRRAAAI